MKDLTSEQDLLLNNLKKAVRNCQIIKTNTRLLKSSFTIDSVEINKLKQEQYKDGEHTFYASALVEIKDKKSSDTLSKTIEFHFNARIIGTEVEIINEMLIGENVFVPFNWEL